MSSDIDRVEELIHAVPRAPGDVLPAGATAEELAAFAARTGVAIPEELGLWLRMCNGPNIGPGGLLGIGVRDFLDIEAVYEQFPQWTRRRWIPIASDGCGNYYVLVSEGGRFPVVFIDRAEGVGRPSYVVASGVFVFLRQLLERELGAKGWPFDEGVVLKTDPELRYFSGRLPLPWEEA